MKKVSLVSVAVAFFLLPLIFVPMKSLAITVEPGGWALWSVDFSSSEAQPDYDHVQLSFSIPTNESQTYLRMELLDAATSATIGSDVIRFDDMYPSPPATILWLASPTLGPDIFDDTLFYARVSNIGTPAFEVDEIELWVESENENPFNGQKYTDRKTMTLESSSVPIPGAVWLLGSGILGFAGIRLRTVS